MIDGPATKSQSELCRSDVPQLVARLHDCKHEAARIRQRPEILAEHDDLYVAVESLAHELETLTWTVTMLGKPRMP